MKHLLYNFKFILKNSLKSIIKVLISSFGIFFLISFLVLYISFRESVKNYVETKLFGKLAINELKIYPRGSKRSRLFSQASIIKGTITPHQVRQIWTLKELKNIQSVIMLDYEVKVQGSLQGSMGGKPRRVHMPIYGIDRSLFKGRDNTWYGFVNKRPVPVIAPKFLYELLTNFLYASGMPTMPPEQFKGFRGKLKIYADAKNSKDDDDDDKKEFAYDAMLYSFTDVFTFAGLIVPKQFVLQFANKNRMVSGKYKKGYKHVMFFATVKDVKDLPVVTTQLKKFGLVVESQHDIAKKTNKVLQIIDDSSLVIIAILCILTIISIFNSYLTIVYNRKQLFSLKRVLGVSKFGIIIGFVIEAVLVGVIYGVTGYVAGGWLINYAAIHLVIWVPALKNVAIVKPGITILFFSIGFSVVISTLSALIPAIFASNVNLFKAVRK